MAQKKNNQDIVNSIAEIAGVTKAQAAKFLQSLTDTIVEGLQTDGNVEINGMGTLGTVKMAGRESVNVANGERIVIDAFTKFTFSPAFISVSQENRNGAENDKPGEVPETDEIKSETDETQPETDADEDVKEEQPLDGSNDEEPDDGQTVEQTDTNEDDLPPVKEKPADAFSGIDVLISTPESLEDARQRLTEAKQKEEELAEKMNSAQMALAQAQRAFDEVKNQLEAAQDEVKTMEENMGNVENNRKAVIDKDNDDDASTAAEDADKPHNLITDSNSKRLGTGDHKEGGKANTDGKKRRMWIIASAAAACVVIALSCMLFCGKQQPAGSSQGQETASSLKAGNANSDKKQTPQEGQEENGGQTAAGQSTTDKEGGTVANTQPEKQENVSQSNAENNLKGTNLIRVDTVVFEGNDLLENIVTKHYGEHDMVYRVIQFNRKKGQLNDLGHIPVGTKILMPHYN